MRTPWLHLGRVRAAARVGALFLLAGVCGCAPSLPFVGARGAGQAQSGPHWSYSGSEGPEHWGELAADFNACANGREQSPIDVPRAKLLKADWLTPLQVKLNPSKVQLVNNGHTIQINYEYGSTLVFDKTTYELRQILLHSPAEHRVNGVGAEMETQLVFSDSLKHQAIVSVMMNAGAENPFFAKFWHALPEKEGAVNREITANVADMLPVDRDYYTYDGSLTAPPCSEGVTWILLKTRVDASADQINRFRAIFGGGSTARPVQPINDRLVKDEDKTAGLPGSTPGR